MPPRNIKVTVRYDGTEFHGWQKQPDTRTVQGEIEHAFQKVFRTPCLTQGASRTDAGVHAAGQAVNFLTEIDIEPNKIMAALNSKLPGDIRLTDANEVPADFNCRFDSKGKIYHYFILNSPQPFPTLRNYSFHTPKELDASAMKKAAAYMKGEEDYASFGNKTEKDENTNCNLEHVTVERPLFPLLGEAQDKLLRIEVKGDRFLYKMVRTIAGTLVEVGKGRLSPEKICDIINSRDRAKAGPTLKPNGLYLMKVLY